ncbi:threonine ammonia-lyase [Nocardioides yefusunii]|uniref:L-threonine dehydratase catabolic TdcB n=1 Tax=Nocardioides yefusunii TaxID=2500546 RepID=A0ABW1QUT0_9ACTN|nr:threonine ammonia-lyase [Nocardioides yefusunii]
MTELVLPGLDDVLAAQEPLRDVALRTPMEESRWLSGVIGAPAFLKCENLQRTGSFKIRGAYTRIHGLGEEERARGVVAASAGNHAQGVALAATSLGIRSTVFMPEGAPIPKENATRAYGADVVFAGHVLEESLDAARAFAADTGAVLVHPFDHPAVVAGQGTVGLEILDQVPDVATVLVPAGGGGLVAGIALAIKARRPDVRVIAVQAAGAAAFPGSLAAGEPRTAHDMRTMADGIAVGLPGEVTFALVRDLVDDVVTVSEGALSAALLALLERAKMVVEPAGAAAVAALMEMQEHDEGPVVAVLSGGNVDPLLLGSVIRHGMAAGGRYRYLRVTIPDRPGGLAALLHTVGESGANVLEVVHHRISPSLEIDQVEVRLQVETRGREHAASLLRRLREDGYVVEG